MTTSCSILFSSLEPPTSKELETADYGPAPDTNNQTEMRKLIVKRLKDLTFFDPNSAEVEECSAPEKAWEYDLGRTKPSKTAYFFGWNFLCDVNVKNRMGGYTGFRRSKMLYQNGSIVDGDNFQWAINGANIGGIPIVGGR